MPWHSVRPSGSAGRAVVVRLGVELGMRCRLGRRIAICWVVRPIGRLPLFTIGLSDYERARHTVVQPIHRAGGVKLNCWSVARDYLLRLYAVADRGPLAQRPRAYPGYDNRQPLLRVSGGCTGAIAHHVTFERCLHWG